MYRICCLWILFFAGTACAQTSGPILMPASGYGSWGTYTVDSIEFYNSVDPTGDTSVIYFPQGPSSPLPTVFFLHGVGGNTPAYERTLFHFIASKGFACVFVPWATSMSVIQAYSVMYNGFLQAGRNYSGIIDSTRIGFVGHSFGGGACYSVAYTLANQNWGTNGLFLMPIAQWYTHAITQTGLQNFPANTYLLSVIYDDDVICDHRMTIDIFRNISIALADKDIVLVTSSQYQSYTYSADHIAVQTLLFDALDVFVTFRLLDAMMDFVFNQNAGAKTVCLGDGSSSQIAMPAGLDSLIVSDTLSAWHWETNYNYACSDLANPRWSYCDISLPVSYASFPAGIYIEEFSGIMYLVNAPAGSTYTIIDARGATVFSDQTESSHHPVPTSFLAPGIYFLMCDNSGLRFSLQHQQ